ncbi:MAG: hypothetical protein ACD_28C00076G0007 [uncultured bacterium]|nr:MAG: hypothetical protein ACD_28C00076G0007 [uncultured bacterium]
MSTEVSQKYEVVIGLEIHAQISTKSKLFCGCDNDSFQKEPNTNVCPICMGFPGMLPVANAVAIEKGIKTALALRCEIPLFSKFDRKNYFYPDLPMGYQISQYDEPISKNGAVEIERDDGSFKTIGITRLHLENDAGKLTHVRGGTLCDYNRSGTPLMEIVTEPDLRSAEEARIFAKTVQAILRAVGSSEADMEKGMMRFDASVSTRPRGEDKLYPRAEIKNLNSFKALESAIEYEVKRQTALWDKGEPMTGAITVGWMDEEQKTKLLRSKEDAADYRYFPEPDLPPLILEQALIDAYKTEVPELPLAKKMRFKNDYGISEKEAIFFSEALELGDYFETVTKTSGDGVKAAAFVGNILVGKLNQEAIALKDCKITAEVLGKLLRLVNEGVISNNTAKSTVFDAMFETGEVPEKIIEAKGLQQVSDTGALEGFIDAVLQANPSVVEEYKSGKPKVIGFLVGQVMKASNGQANPGTVNELIQKKLAS